MSDEQPSEDMYKSQGIYDALVNVGNVFGVGAQRQGKTIAGFQIAVEKAKHLRQPIYSFKHANPMLLEEMLGEWYFGDIDDINLLLWMQDCVIVCDEAHKTFTSMSRIMNQKLANILSTSNQKAMSIIFISQNFDVMPEQLMINYIDVVFIKKMIPNAIQESSRRYAKNRYSDVAHKDKKTIFFHVTGTGERAMLKCDVPEWWLDDVSQAYKKIPTDRAQTIFENQQGREKKKQEAQRRPWGLTGVSRRG